ncbi:MAG: DUF1127 domain-containing protein [Geminicoccaceae bacterium]|nr:MAG: DUF1127 domain-containing protein [Geminicoccaceae bacterium]
MQPHHEAGPRAIAATLPADRTENLARQLGLILLRALGHGLLVTWTTLWTWRERECSRRHLGELDQRMLRDIGLTREAAPEEVQKRFWEP